MSGRQVEWVGVPGTWWDRSLPALWIFPQRRIPWEEQLVRGSEQDFLALSFVLSTGCGPFTVLEPVMVQ